MSQKKYQDKEKEVNMDKIQSPVEVTPDATTIPQAFESLFEVIGRIEAKLFYTNPAEEAVDPSNDRITSVVQAVESATSRLSAISDTLTKLN